MNLSSNPNHYCLKNFGLILFMKLILYTSLALLAFAGNSILCRFALTHSDIDPASFTTIRLLSGAIVLWFLILISGASGSTSNTNTKGGWIAAAMLFGYAITFSYAYVSLDTGTGALILFTAVQLTMLLSSFFAGKKISILEWTGAGIAFLGFVYLMLPTLSTPSALGLLLMTISGIAWGFYTLIGKSSRQPLADTQSNFSKTVPMAFATMIIAWPYAEISVEGAIIAIVAGGITSGIGYAIWYAALRNLTAVRASVLQLSVPVISALGGALFSDEQISMRLSLSAAVIFCGILLVISAGKKKPIRT